MKRYKGLIFITSILIFFCFVSTAVFTSNSFFHFFDLSSSKAQNIGGAIGGITAPIIGLFSSILLYLALIKQVESNREQQLKNESDIIFSLFSQLDNEIDNFYYKFEDGKTKVKYTGLEGLAFFASEFRYNYDVFHGSNKETFTKVFYEAGFIAIMVDSYNLIKERISISSLSNEMKILFYEKLKSIYNGKLKIPLLSFSEAFDIWIVLEDGTTDKIQKLVKNSS